MFYTDYAEYIARFFPGEKVQKISVNTGSNCPNRDGTIGRGGCIYCNNASFTPAYCFDKDSISAQLEKGKQFFARKYPRMRYIAYFQSYTNTYGRNASELERAYREAMSVEGVCAIAIGTRPDCLSEETIVMLSRLNRELPIFVELGVESLNDETLSVINRGHTAAQAREAIVRLADAGLHVGVHLIAGLPGETEVDILRTVDEICSMPIESLKMHHLQVLRGTRLHELRQQQKIEIIEFTPESYLELCVKIVERVPKGIAIERFLASAPPAMVVAPKWGLKNYEFTHRLIKKLKEQPHTKSISSGTETSTSPKN